MNLWAIPAAIGLGVLALIFWGQWRCYRKRQTLLRKIRNRGLEVWLPIPLPLPSPPLDERRVQPEELRHAVEKILKPEVSNDGTS